MATRLKTVQYAFPVLTTMANNTLTNVPQITVSLPESGKTIREAWVEVSMDDIITATGGTVTTKTINLRLGAAAYTSTTNANAVANTAENVSWQFTREFTSHFTANWSGTSMTCDVQLQINQSTGTTPGMNNVCVILYVTYEYDDTSTTQLKTVLVPLNAPAASPATTKTSYDTVPALDTYLPEASKTYRSIAVIFLSNTMSNSTTDFTMSFELSSLGVHTTQIYEGALNTDRFVRYVWDITSYITTNSTHSFNMWSSLANSMDAPLAYMLVTYEFNASTTTSVMNSVNLPMEIDSPMGGTSAADFQRSTREVWVEEPNPVRQRLAFYMYWQGANNETGLNARIGTGSFIAYTVTGSGSIAGNKNLMIRNDNPTGVPFARGRTTLQMDVYNTSTTQRGGNVGGFWILNYTSDVAAAGIGAHNHTVIVPMYTQSTATATQQYITTANAPIIPEANYFVTGLGFNVNFMQGVVQQGFTLKVERTVAEGGLIFERVYSDVSQHDAELGAYDIFAQARSFFGRWANDADTTRLNLETARRYVINSSNAVTWLNHVNMYLTYHSITFTAADTITGFSGTVNLGLHRVNGGEKVLETSRSGDGSFSFTWYDDTEPLYVVANDGSTVGRSEDTLAS